MVLNPKSKEKEEMGGTGADTLILQDTTHPWSLATKTSSGLFAKLGLDLSNPSINKFLLIHPKAWPYHLEA